MARCERGLMPATYRVKTYWTLDWSAAACSKAAVKSPVSSLMKSSSCVVLVFGHIGSLVDDLGAIRLYGNPAPRGLVRYWTGLR